MADLRFAVFGAGFWAHPQLSGWRELPGARCVAIYNRTVAKAERLIEGTKGTIELAPGCLVRTTTAEGTTVRRHPPAKCPWLHPDYTVSQSSIADCQRSLLAALRGEGRAETTADDNLRTLRLVFGAYDSAARGGALVTLPEARP